MEAICKADYDRRLSAKDDAEEKAKLNKSVIVPHVGFHDVYGVWFFGSLCTLIHQVRLSRFGVDEEKMMHVFIDTEPGKILDGIHDITVYGQQCLLYKWTAQGYHRGLVVLRDDISACAAAQVYLESRTWSWVLNADDRAKLPPASPGCIP